MFAGRIEEDKGVFDLVEVARRLDPLLGDRLAWHVCGGGAAEAPLRDAVARAGLSHRVHVHGRLDRDALLDVWRGCAATIVPTTAACPEGLNKVAVESVLLRRPVVVTDVVPAHEVLDGAVVVTRPGDVEAMAEAVRRLATDRSHYEGLSGACERLAEPFFDSDELWGRVVQRLIQEVQQERGARA